MNRESKLWLLGAGGVAVVVLAVVLIFGLSFAPDFPSLYDGGPTVEGTVAYIEFGPDDCLYVLDVASGEDRELYCDDWLGFEGWDADGYLQILSGNGHHEELLILDPNTGAVVRSDEFRPDERPPLDQPRTDAERRLRASSREGHVTLSYRQGDSEVTLIDVEGSRDYSFWDYGVTSDEKYAWICDSEDRLLVVALDGTGGPWVVADDIGDPIWK
jgi:hypothetical protein